MEDGHLYQAGQLRHDRLSTAPDFITAAAVQGLGRLLTSTPCGCQAHVPSEQSRWCGKCARRRQLAAQQSPPLHSWESLMQRARGVRRSAQPSRVGPQSRPTPWYFSWVELKPALASMAVCVSPVRLRRTRPALPRSQDCVIRSSPSSPPRCTATRARADRCVHMKACAPPVTHREGGKAAGR
jgi:hypothetical protein